MTERTIYLVWNSDDRCEAVAFDNYDDAYRTSTGEFTMNAPSIGVDFFESYEENAPLPIQKIIIPFEQERPQ